MKIAIITDIHEDKKRLDKTFKILESQNVDQIICLGDMVGFCVPFYPYLNSRDSNYVVDMIRQNCSDVVIGNHDLFALKKIPSNPLFFNYPENWYELEFDVRKKMSKEKIYLYEHNELSTLLSKRNLDYLDTLPEYIFKDINGDRVLLSHYYFPDITGSSTFEAENSSDLDVHFSFMKENNCILSFTGNDHIEGVRLFYEETQELIEFNSFSRLKRDLLAINCPTISKGTFRNGFTIFDTDTYTIEACKLNSKILKIK